MTEMRGVVKFGALAVGCGVVIGLGVVGWLYTHKPDADAKAEKPGIVSGGGSVLSTNNGDSSGADGLSVTQNGDQGLAVGRQAGSGGEGVASGPSAGGGSGTPGSG
jgi:hypothetical protein